jgi:hypothetical protein
LLYSSINTFEVWGSNGTLSTNRIFSAPAGFRPTVAITTNNATQQIEIDSDDSFLKSILQFKKLIDEPKYDEILQQAQLVAQFHEKNQR